jgi:hypothetical protein
MSRRINLVVVEGVLEVPAALKILRTLKLPTEDLKPINLGGRVNFWRSAPKYNRAAAVMGPIFGLTDLDQSPCPSGLIEQHLTSGKHPHFALRLAERELESWLLADMALAVYLRISPDLLPLSPDTERNPKQTLVNLARRSPSRDVRADLVPEAGSKGVVGKGYTLRMTEFIEQKWQPLEAQYRSESLKRALAAVKKVSQP